MYKSFNWFKRFQVFCTLFNIKHDNSSLSTVPSSDSSLTFLLLRNEIVFHHHNFQLPCLLSSSSCAIFRKVDCNGSPPYIVVCPWLSIPSKQLLIISWCLHICCPASNELVLLHRLVWGAVFWLSYHSDFDIAKINSYIIVLIFPKTSNFCL